MKKIYKYPFTITDHQDFELSEEAKVINVDLDPFNRPYLWAIIDVKAPIKKHTLYVVGTGLTVPKEAEMFLGSFQQPPFVWHVFMA